MAVGSSARMHLVISITCAHFDDTIIMQDCVLANT